MVGGGRGQKFGRFSTLVPLQPKESKSAHSWNELRTPRKPHKDTRTTHNTSKMTFKRVLGRLRCSHMLWFINQIAGKWDRL